MEKGALSAYRGVQYGQSAFMGAGLVVFAGCGYMGRVIASF